MVNTQTHTQTDSISAILYEQLSQLNYKNEHLVAIIWQVVITDLRILLPLVALTARTITFGIISAFQSALFQIAAVRRVQRHAGLTHHFFSF